MSLEKKTKADRPHYVAIVLSSLALLITGLNWWEGHRGRILNEQINRPVFLVSNVEYETSRIDTPETAGLEVNVNIKLKNTGKIPADLLEYGVASYLKGLGIEDCIERPLGESSLHFPQTVLPGMEVKLTGHAIIRDEIKPKCRTSPLHITLGIRTLYYEPSSSQPYHQYLSEELVVPLEKRHMVTP
jgi:hypothetical protein